MLNLSSLLCYSTQMRGVHYLPRGLAITGCKKRFQLEINRITKEFEKSLEDLQHALQKDPSHIECSEFNENMTIRYVTAQELSEQKLAVVEDQVNQLNHLAHKMQDANIRWRMYNSGSKI